jgi:molybdenum cofactor cytidylyltransferase
MKFGPCPASDAAGAYLAHSVKINGSFLKKGRLLTADDISRLIDAGINSVTVARLEAGDLHEDEAASRLSKALLGPGLKESAAFTGRANLIAAGPGVLVVDKSKIDRINQIHESVTVATLPEYAAVESRQMAATIKIIPFSAPESAVLKAEALALKDGPAIRVSPYAAKRAVLIQSTLETIKSSVLDKTVDITANRLRAVGGELIGEIRCRHDAEAIASAIKEAAKSSPDIFLIAGASAICDRADALPRGIEDAGGEVLHFGMPVDPGNLILFGTLTGKPVIGLPGCARSPKLNGFDWALQRIAADIPLTPSDVQGMGVGGLLAEIGARPLPREEATRDRTQVQKAPKVAAVVLAAGQSRRMGAENKLLEVVNGKSMVVHAVETALAADTTSVTVVVGHQAEQVKKALANFNVSFVLNPNYDAGLSTSLKAAADVMPEEADALIVLLGDMPQVTARHVDRLIAAFNPLEGRAICVPTHEGKRGNPVLWARHFVKEMSDLRGDVGAKHLIGMNEDSVAEVEMSDPAILRDIDTPEALAAIRAESN